LPTCSTSSAPKPPIADGRLDYYEDHYVRKIAHLLYVPNTDSMLARNRARS
jgi:uncharacterized tellurite resistance protein B-like protein